MEAKKVFLHESINDLRNSLENLKGLYNSYLDVAKQQRQALISHNLQRNLELNQNCETLLEEMSLWEGRRQCIVEKLANHFGISHSDGVRLDDIIPFVEQGILDDLLELRKELKQILAELRNVLGINKALAENGRKIIQQTFSIITSSRVKNEKNPGVYSAGGKTLSNKKQNHQLVNYKV